VTAFAQAMLDWTALVAKSGAMEPAVEAVGTLLIRTLRAGGQVLTCGNGGSAADALHLAEELMGKYERPRRPLPAVCLNADVTALTCIANDFGYEQVFARQVVALGRPGDLLIAFSTSGNSPNVLAALQAARARQMVTVLLAGGEGGRAKELGDHALLVPSASTARIQEMHTLILHAWLAAVDAESWD
jgi:D-sedoheptulose 7-phosphate isomerase